jgi:hypothetical protein
MQPKPTNLSARILQLVLLAGLIYAALNYQNLLDDYALATFHPTSEMAAIESRLDLTTSARAALYRAQAQVDDKVSFNKDCDTQPHELELGCYFHGRIYVLRIDNPSLAPEMDVVTSHELLHAVWANMSSSDRKTLGTELEQEYNQVGSDDLKQRMAGYAQTEPGEQDNELHSILGTEIASLPPELEQHYDKYFTNRQAIVSAHAAYESVFNSRRTELESQLAMIRTEKAQLAVLNKQLETYKDAGQIDVYNSLVPRQNRMVDDINSKIADYRQGVDEYNALSKSLDSQEITDTETTAQ